MTPARRNHEWRPSLGSRAFRLEEVTPSAPPWQNGDGETLRARRVKPGSGSWRAWAGLAVVFANVVPAAEPARPREAPQAALVPPPPLSPEESRRKIRLPAGFQVELAAAEPLVLDPVAFDWDERGRLWVVEMADYPLGMEGKGKAGGRVRILEDSNRDGDYDRATLFAEEISFPTGILTWRGGCIVTAAPRSTTRTSS